jgi:hypothetical protein
MPINRIPIIAPEDKAPLTPAEIANAAQATLDAAAFDADELGAAKATETAAKAIQDAAEAAEKSFESAADRFKDAIQTPIEKFAETAELLNLLVSKGLLNADESALALAIARESAVSALMSDLREDPQSKGKQFDFSTAKEIGSAAAHAAIIRARVGIQNDPAQEERKKQTALQGEIKGVLDAVVVELQEDNEVEIPQP